MSKPNHTVFIDRIVDDIVYIRDPWNIEKGFGDNLNGTEATMQFDDFIHAWDFGSNGFLWIKK